jgi:hypothetical protein
VTSEGTPSTLSPAWDGHERKRILAQCRCPVCGEALHPGVERKDWESVQNFPRIRGDLPPLLAGTPLASFPA